MSINVHLFQIDTARYNYHSNKQIPLEKYHIYRIIKYRGVHSSRFKQFQTPKQITTLIKENNIMKLINGFDLMRYAQARGLILPAFNTTNL